MSVYTPASAIRQGLSKTGRAKSIPLRVCLRLLETDSVALKAFAHELRSVRETPWTQNSTKSSLVENRLLPELDASNQAAYVEILSSVARSTKPFQLTVHPPERITLPDQTKTKLRCKIDSPELSPLTANLEQIFKSAGLKHIGSGAGGLTSLNSRTMAIAWASPSRASRRGLEEADATVAIEEGVAKMKEIYTTFAPRTLTAVGLQLERCSYVPVADSSGDSQEGDEEQIPKRIPAEVMLEFPFSSID